jgi:hypothetical protein
MTALSLYGLIVRRGIIELIRADKGQFYIALQKAKFATIKLEESWIPIQ